MGYSSQSTGYSQSIGGEPGEGSNNMVSAGVIILTFVYLIYVYIVPVLIFILIFIFLILTIYNFCSFYIQKIVQMFKMLKPNYKFLIKEYMSFKLLDYARIYTNDRGDVYNDIVDDSLDISNEKPKNKDSVSNDNSNEKPKNKGDTLKDNSNEKTKSKGDTLKDNVKTCGNKKEPLSMLIYANDYVLASLLYILISILCAIALVIIVIFFLWLISNFDGSELKANWMTLISEVIKNLHMIQGYIESYNNFDILKGARIEYIYILCIIIFISNIAFRFKYFDRFIEDAIVNYNTINDVEKNIKKKSIYGESLENEANNVAITALRDKINEKRDSITTDDIIDITKKYITNNINNEANYNNIRVFLTLASIVYFLMDKNKIDIDTILNYINIDLLNETDETSDKKCPLNFISMLREDTIIDNIVREDDIVNRSNINNFDKIFDKIIKTHDIDIYHANETLVSLPNLEKLNNNYEIFLISSFVINIAIILIFIYIYIKTNDDIKNNNNLGYQYMMNQQNMQPEQYA